jgi:hypothetical protein
LLLNDFPKRQLMHLAIYPSSFETLTKEIVLRLLTHCCYTLAA